MFGSNIAKINQQNLENEVTLRLGNNKLRYCSEQRWILGLRPSLTQIM
jgi:hypothetical protein